MTQSSHSLVTGPTQSLAVAISNPGALGTLEAYITAVNQQPMLSLEEERDLGERLQKDGDLDAARRLIMSHLRLVVSTARQYIGYGLPHARSEEHTSELQSRFDLVCRLLLEKKKTIYILYSNNVTVHY